MKRNQSSSAAIGRGLRHEYGTTQEVHEDASCLCQIPFRYRQNTTGVKKEFCVAVSLAKYLTGLQVCTKYEVKSRCFVVCKEKAVPTLALY